MYDTEFRCKAPFRQGGSHPGHKSQALDRPGSRRENPPSFVHFGCEVRIYGPRQSVQNLAPIRLAFPPPQPPKTAWGSGRSCALQRMP